MDPLQFLVPLDWIEVVGPILPFAILVMALANLATRHLAHKQHVEQAEAGDSVDQFTPHVFTNVGLLLLSLLFTLDSPTGGVILSLLVVTMLVADLFEFEARNVEARNDMTVELPKSALVSSGLVVLYAVYYALFFVVADFWGEFVVA
ncbi:hypothetical protein JCM17823_12750 [Halorubrum gandharaense]